jgi:hypothetical protein
MMTIGATHHFFRGAENARDIVDGDAELQEHRGAGVPQNVRCNLGTKSRKVASSAPSSAFLRPYRMARIFDNMRSR